MSVFIGIALLLFGGGFFARQVRSVPQHAWTGPRTKAQKQRGATKQRSVRQELKLIAARAQSTDWLEQRRHDRKNGTAPATGKTTHGRYARVPAPAKPVMGTVIPPLQRAKQAAQARFAPRPRPSSNGTTQTAPATPSRPAGAPTPSSPSPGRTTTVAASGNAVEQLVEGVNQIHATAQAGGLKAKQNGVKASHEGSVRFAQMAAMLSRAMSEPGMNYGPEITEPIAKAGTHLQAAAMAWSEADAALASLANMTVGDLAESSRQAPHHTELTENGSR